ncbi:MAG: hypothetical protein NZ772_01450 [Cyanobacteria bacterium]|nr:hypothetical protein [Cyanobacteriota bacterium]MDW8200127.1 hypothetical protein [Cyanobacteriota bacterium SKYGB_h_bin112]
MNLEQQQQDLIAQAATYGVPTEAMRTIVATLTKAADQFRHQLYYIPQSLDNEWVVTTLSHRERPTQEKQVVYAFADLNDVTVKALGSDDLQLVARPMPLLHILFQMFALPTIDSVIFMDTPGNIATGIEVPRADIQSLIQQCLRQWQAKQVPSDIA